MPMLESSMHACSVYGTARMGRLRHSTLTRFCSLVKETETMRCPHCNCRDIGKIGANQFYCWGCFMEFSVTGEEVRVYEVAEDGSLISVGELPGDLEVTTSVI